MNRKHLRSLKFATLRQLPWSWWGPVLRLATGSNGHARAFRRTRVGKGSYVDPSVQIAGWQNVRVGQYTTVSEGGWLNVNHRDTPVDRIIIGNHCHIGRNNFFSSGPLIELQDYCFTGLDCRLLGCGHETGSPTQPYLASGLTPGAPIVLGCNTWLTTEVTVLEGVEIGRGSVIGARSLVSKSIPPFSVAVGSPCTVLKRFDFKNNAWIPASQWHDELDLFLPSTQEYLELLRRAAPELGLSLFSGSRRFGWL